MSVTAFTSEEINQARRALGESFAGYCVRYLRVSDERQTFTDADVVKDGNSIDTQRKACFANEQRRGLVCLAEYIEPGTSAQSVAKRKVFQLLLRRLTEERDVSYLSIYMRSRAFRDYIEAGSTERQLGEVGIKMISAKEEYGDDIHGQFMKAVTDVVNWYEARRNGVDIKEKMANKVKNGGTPSKAKLGYLNVTLNQEGRKVNTIVVDPARKALVLATWELMSTGQHTLDTLHDKVAAMGLRSRPTKRYPNGNIITQETLRSMLRDRYYIGWVQLDGVEYQGRHETFISEELFDRVQRVLDAHQGAGIREREHPHYLKGWLWCGRCSKRFIVQRAVGGRGGIYYYFFCRGRQEGLCDHPYVPIEKMEELVELYYAEKVRLPEGIKAQLRQLVDHAVQSSSLTSSGLRDQLQGRVEALDKKESYLLDLASEEGWPKDVLRGKLQDIRAERQGIQRELSEASSALETGWQVVLDALKLMERPADLYREAMADADGKPAGGELVRSILNKAFFERFYVDGNKITKAQHKEPFDLLLGDPLPDEARIYLRESARLHLPEVGRKRGRRPAKATQIAPCPDHQLADRARIDVIMNLSEPTLTDLLELAQLQRVSGSSKTVMVGDTGFEPVTSSVSKGKRIHIYP